MFFSRVASIFALSTVALVSAAPIVNLNAGVDVAGLDAAVAVGERQIDVSVQVTDALNTLLSTTESILPQISALDEITDDTIAPLLTELVGAVDTTVTTLSGITGSATGGLLARTAGDDVANILRGVLSTTADTLNPILADVQGFPIAGELLTTLSPVLNTLLSTVEGLIPGVLSLVSGLVDTTTGLLNSVLGGLLGGIL